MHITIRQLQVFEAVARHASYTRAAEGLHLTQPAVSMQIKQLEGSVGLPLFEQIGKRIFLTQAGEAMLRHAQTIIGHLAAAREEMDDLKGVDSGRLRIAVASTVNYFATRLLARFARQHPGVKITLDVTNRETLLQNLEHNLPDVVLMGAPPKGLDLQADAFMDNPLIMIAPPDHRFTKRRTIALGNLDTETFVIRESGSGTRIAMERFFNLKAFEPCATIEMTDNEAIKQSVEAGLGLAIVSIHTVELELAAKRLIKLNIKGMPIKRRWYVGHRRGKRLSPTAQAFRQFVIDEGARQAVS
ncbi:MAG: LysR family transcriptional regulator [Pseudomonadota bacterium]|nr:LysR family transcriptional regulator [Pseudomonadota bacterium]